MAQKRWKIYIKLTIHDENNFLREKKPKEKKSDRITNFQLKRRFQNAYKKISICFFDYQTTTGRKKIIFLCILDEKEKPLKKKKTK